MSLQKSAAAFKSSLAGAADLLPSRPKPVPAPAPVSTPAPPPPPSASSKRKRPVPTATPIYSQPAQQVLGQQHIFTQVHHAIQYLKEKERPLRPSDVASYLSIPVDSAVFNILKNNERITFNSTTDTLEFRPLHNIRSAMDLLKFLQSQTTAQGLSVKELKEGWAGAMDAIEGLERSGDILVTRTKKDNAARMVWSNDKTLKCDIDEDFRDMWHKIRIPGTAEIVGDLEKMGLKPASVDPATVKKEVKSGGQKGRKRAVNRRAKVSNTHMSGILKDSKDLRR